MRFSKKNQKLPQKGGTYRHRLHLRFRGVGLFNLLRAAGVFDLPPGGPPTHLRFRRLSIAPFLWSLPSPSFRIRVTLFSQTMALFVPPLFWQKEEKSTRVTSHPGDQH